MPAAADKPVGCVVGLSVAGGHFDCDQLHSARLSFALVTLSCPFEYFDSSEPSADRTHGSRTGFCMCQQSACGS